MTFYSSTDGQYIQEGTAFTIGEISYPNNWLNLSTPEEKAAIGLEEVIATNSPANQAYYWVSEELNEATLTYINTPKELAPCQESAVSQVNASAYAILLPSDYIDSRNLRDATYKPEWIVWRDSIRAQAKSAIASINACTTIEQLAALPSVLWEPSPDQQIPA